MARVVYDLNAEVSQPPDAYALARALTEWRVIMDEKGWLTGAPWELRYTRTKQRHCKLLIEMGCILSEETQQLYLRSI